MNTVREPPNQYQNDQLLSCSRTEAQEQRARFKASRGSPSKSTSCSDPGGGVVVYTDRMSNEAWRPVIPTGREDALQQGFPGYLREAVFGWLQGALGAESRYVKAQKFVDFQNVAHLELGFTSGGVLDWHGKALPQLRRLDDAIFTNFVDYTLSQNYYPKGPHPLERILSDGGSAWTVVRWNRMNARLAERVPSGVRASVGSVLSATDKASMKLKEAWLDAYGTNPRASVAYAHAVVAVETAALSLMPTGKDEPTLASVFSLLESDNPKWTLVFRDSERAPNSKTLAAMMRTLWRGHESRHGRPEYTDATLEEARGAVILAATLVQWITSGVVVPTAAR